MLGLLVSVVLACALQGSAQHYSATYLPDTAPDHTENGQSGTNKCGTASHQDSQCQNLFVNAVDDFCLFAPPNPGANSDIGNTERIEVAWCLRNGYGTRLIPDGTLKGAHFVQTPDYVQVTGIGDFTKMNVPAGDAGGELDPHGADGNGNPIGGLVFSSAFGQLQQIHEWTNFMSATEFCIRACKPGPNAPKNCQHIYDVMGCQWNMPANYDAGTFENCQGDSAQPMGVYGTSTFHQGDPSTPPAHPIPSSSNCKTFATLSSGAQASPPPPPPAGGSTSTPSSSPQSLAQSSTSIVSNTVTVVLPANTNTPGGTNSKGPAPSNTAGGSSNSKDSAMANFVSYPAVILSVLGAVIAMI